VGRLLLGKFEAGFSWGGGLGVDEDKYTDLGDG
jgi:hypothetical protein